jgi:pimeloyl-ACP methyl ester carboxylesterase
VATPTKTSFQLAGAGGGPLRGNVRRSKDALATVVICHGFKGFKDWGFYPMVTDRLARAGFAVVSFNYSGSGVGEDGLTFSEPERFGHGTYTNHLRDLDVVLHALRDGRLGHPPTSLGLLGHSMGGGIATLRAAADPAVSVLVTWAATALLGRPWRSDQVAEWRRTGKIDVTNQRTGQILPLYTDMLEDWENNRAALDVTAAAGKVRAPWLIVHGAADESVPASDAQDLLARAPTARTLIVEGAGHTFGIAHPWAGSTAAFDRVLDATVEWFTRHLVG